MRRFFLIIFIVLFIGLGVTEVLLPRYYENQVETALRQQVAGVDALEVKIRTHPALLLLTGRVQHSSFKTRGVIIDQVRIDSLESRYEDLVFVDTPQGTRAFGGSNLFFQADILEEDLNKYLKTILPQLDELRVELKPDKAIVYVKLQNWIDLKLTGTLEIVDDYRIRFVPIDLDEARISAIFVSQVLSALEFDLGLKDSPIPLDVKEIKILEGKIQALGGSEV